MRATWRSVDALCRERDWSKPRLLYELQNGFPNGPLAPCAPGRGQRDLCLIERRLEA